MENLRWILIFAGVAILVLLYYSGRPKRTPEQREARRNSTGAAGHSGAAMPDALLADDSLEEQFAGFDEVDPTDFERPGGASSSAAGHSRSRLSDSLPSLDVSGAAAGGLSSISSKIEAFSERLSPKRRQRVAASEPLDLADEPESAGYASKIVTLHLVAPEGRLFDGAQLLNVFEQRGYHFGEMNIFHSMHQGKTVFSIAKMIEPGYFDIDHIDSFETPGISLILQLPGPVPADVAFEVLVSEAFDMGTELGGTVLDADRSTLSKQTVQHMREGIYEYMHRQKYFNGVPS